MFLSKSKQFKLFKGLRAELSGSNLASKCRKFSVATESSSSSSSIPSFVRIVEVGPRDGLQNEKTNVPTDIKVQFIDKLVAAGQYLGLCLLLSV